MGFLPGMQGWFNIQKLINLIYYLKEYTTKPHAILINAEKVFEIIKYTSL